MKLAVLGAGSFGCALAEVLVENNHQVILWTHHLEHAQQLRKTRENPYINGAFLDPRIKITANIKEVKDCQLIVFVVPSFALRETAKKVNQILTSPKVMVICTKGLEATTMKSGYTIIGEEISKVKAQVILSGPTHAEELALKKFTTIVSTSTNQSARELVQKVFNCSYLRVYTNDDITGVEILGAAKNVLAIGAGFCDAHQFLGDNTKAALLTRGLRELKTIGEYEGCRAETFYGLTGLGDLLVTAMSQYSRNRKFGELLGRGYTKEQAQSEIGMVIEGLYSVEAIHKLMVKNNLDLPVIDSIYRILYKNQPLEEILEELTNRETKSEE